MDSFWKCFLAAGLTIIIFISVAHAQNTSNDPNTNGRIKAPYPGTTQTHKTTTAMALLLDDNNKTRFYVKNGMFIERTHDNGDNLWRTSLAFIAYEHPALKAGMLSCTQWEKNKRVRYFRSVEQDDETVSRDQLTMFLVAMAEGDENVKRYIKATPWRISKKYTLTIDMWLWMKALGGSKIARTLFYMVEIPIAKFYQLWNKRKTSKGRFPSYALHLLAWQVHSLKNNSNMDHTLKSIILKMTPDDNHLIRLLMCEGVSQAEIDAVIPKTDFQWQRDSYTKAEVRPLTPEEAEYNAFDVDILQNMYNKAKAGK